MKIYFFDVSIMLPVVFVRLSIVHWVTFDILSNLYLYVLFELWTYVPPTIQADLAGG